MKNENVNMCHVGFLGIEPTTFSAANAMLYHWATGTQWSTASDANE